MMENLDTQYYKNDIIRTLQLTKFLLLSEPAKMAKMLANNSFTSNSRKEFLSNILNNDEIIKEFRKTNVDRLAAILKNSGLKAAEMAEMLEHNVLNKKTRKLFLNSLMEQENIRKLAKPKKIRKLDMPLEKFFTNF
jgi:F0F1-type ATP synthase delta subunit